MVQVKDGVSVGSGLSIGEVAQLAGIAASAIRFYERHGLLEAPERVSGRRRYDASVLRRLAMIQVGQDAGFTLAQIRTLLDGLSAEQAPSPEWRALAHDKLVDVDALIVRAKAMKRLLQDGLACECLSLEDRDDFLAACGEWATTKQSGLHIRGTSFGGPPEPSIQNRW